MKLNNKKRSFHFYARPSRIATINLCFENSLKFIICQLLYICKLNKFNNLKTPRIVAHRERAFASAHNARKCQKKDVHKRR